MPFAHCPAQSLPGCGAPACDILHCTIALLPAFALRSLIYRLDLMPNALMTARATPVSVTGQRISA
jgi:hypothetical protein